MALTVSWERGSRVPGRLRTFAKKTVSVVTSTVAHMVKPHRAALQNLAHMPLSVLGTTAVDFAAFHVNHGVGWLVTGASLFVLERMIADDDQ